MSIPRLSDAELSALIAAAPQWTLREDGKALTRSFKFKDFYSHKPLSRYCDGPGSSNFSAR